MAKTGAENDRRQKICVVAHGDEHEEIGERQLHNVERRFENAKWRTLFPRLDVCA